MKKFETWFKKESGETGRQMTTDGVSASTCITELLKGNQPLKDVGKYIFFDYENGW